MPSLYQTIKKAAANYIENAGLSDVMYATVVTETGAIRIEQNGILIPEDMVDIPGQFADREVSVILDGEEKTIVIKDKLVIGQRIAVIRKQGGQRFTVIGWLA